MLSTRPKKRKRKGTIKARVGGIVPKPLVDYLTLYCNALVVPKSQILHKLLLSWWEELQKDYPQEKLEKKIALLLYNNKSDGQSFETFLHLAQMELRVKKLEEVIVQRILKHIKYEYKKNTDAKKTS